MHITSFRYFLSVADSGSVRAASERLNVSASAISRQIKLLEHSFKTELFERRSDGMFLTPEGKILSQHMRQTMRDLDLARGQIDEIHNIKSGTVRFSAIEGVMSSWVLRIISSFSEKYPGVDFECNVSASKNVIEDVISNEVDFGVAIFSQSPPEIDTVLKLDTAIVAVMQNDHPLAAQRIVKLNDLVKYPMISLDDGFETKRLFDEAVNQCDIRPRIICSMNHIESIKSYVREFGAVSVLPDYAVSEEVKRGQLWAAKIDKLLNVAPSTVLIRRRERRLLPAAKLFIDYLNEQSNLLH
ncbi:LysR family transcriptional regulator [Ruegeria profundi]|uniref:LysR family transcriptional regulator n=1 Tax=Ruegeria profundi TaxID=1685378 RepID=UPI001CD6978E|nr:LysR family transcriptional regulator [Ruegeria profundi]MCA0927644.1 LysR family transcriptional regulator [Ruegeria profundi]